MLIGSHRQVDMVAHHYRARGEGNCRCGTLRPGFGLQLLDLWYDFRASGLWLLVANVCLAEIITCILPEKEMQEVPQGFTQVGHVCRFLPNVTHRDPQC